MEKRQKNNLDFLKFLAIYLVVLSHCLIYYGNISQISLNWYYVIYIICRIHVPLFLFIAGYLCHKQNINKFYLKKVYRILIPFLFFSFMKLLFTWIFAPDMAHADSIGYQLYDAFILCRLYWFPMTIFIIYLLAPLFWHNNKKNNLLTILVIIACLTTTSLMDFCDITYDVIFQLRKVVNCLPYFLIGLLISKNGLDRKNNYILKTILLIISVISVISISILFYKDVYKFSYLLDILCSLGLIYILMLITAKIRRIKVINLIAKYSLQIMFLDGFFRLVLFKLFFKMNFINIPIVFLISVLIILLSVLVCMIIDKIPFISTLIGLRKNKN